MTQQSEKTDLSTDTTEDDILRLGAEGPLHSPQREEEGSRSNQEAERANSAA